jgi:hypothetical protein
MWLGGEERRSRRVREGERAVGRHRGGGGGKETALGRHQAGHAGAAGDALDRCADEDIAQKLPAMRSHDDQIGSAGARLLSDDMT